MSQSKKIFLTGASGGIGTAVCEKFISNDFTLVLTASSNEKINILKNKYGEKHYYYNVDLSNAENLQNNLDIISKDDDNQDKAVLIIKQGLVDHSFVADPEINLASVMIKLARLSNG